MTNKEQMFKMIEGRIETMQKLAIECIEMIYEAGILDGANDALESAAKFADGKLSEEIRSLKK